jgi:hypothetical protein
LGTLVQRAREAAGHPFRPSFAEVAGPGLSVRSLLNLESGAPVSAKVYEAAGRTLGRYFRDWSESTPLSILEEKFAPTNVPRGDQPELEPEPGGVEVVEPGSDATHYPEMEDLLRAVFRQLRKQNIPHEAIMRAAERRIEELKREASTTERNGPDAASGRVS